MAASMAASRAVSQVALPAMDILEVVSPAAEAPEDRRAERPVVFQVVSREAAPGDRVAAVSRVFQAVEAPGDRRVVSQVVSRAFRASREAALVDRVVVEGSRAFPAAYRAATLWPP